MKTECENESWRRKKVEDYAEDKKDESMKIHCFTTNKQQKHHSSVHCLLLLSDTIFCSLSAFTIKYHL